MIVAISLQSGVLAAFAFAVDQARGNSDYRLLQGADPAPRRALAAIAASTPPTAWGRTELALCRTMRDALLRRSEAAALIWADIEPATARGGLPSGPGAPVFAPGGRHWPGLACAATL